MTIFRVIPPGDIALTDPDPITLKRLPVILTGAQYARQKIITRLRFFEREWFIDLRQGIPYFTDIYVQNPNLDRIRAIYRKVLLSVQEIQSIDRLELKFNRSLRTLSVEFDVSLVSGGVLVVRQPDPPFIISFPRAA